MRYHIQPVVERLGITKRVSWHTFRRTFATLLKANGEDIKVVQELCGMVHTRDFGHLRTGADARKTGGTAEGR